MRAFFGASCKPGLYLLAGIGNSEFTYKSMESVYNHLFDTCAIRFTQYFISNRPRQLLRKMTTQATVQPNILRDIDPQTPFLQQLQDNNESGPITLVNTFVIPSGEMPNVIELWRKEASIMQATPGFISTQLHRGTGSSNVLVNVAIWESAAALREGFENKVFQAALMQYPPGTVAYPHVLQRVAVDNICTAHYE